MNRQERRRLERQRNKFKKVNKETIEYKQGYEDGIKEGILRERGNWVQALENTKGIGGKLFARILDQVGKIYKGELL